jgi:osmotically-inducible protein OsmY
MKILSLGLMCGMLMACNRTDTPVTSNPSTPANSTTVTAERPKTAPETNTGVNTRDRDGTAKTPIDQNENKADIKTTADIRKRVVDTKLSVDAQNVKIITQDGKVTLRGPVESAEEKSTIEKIANDVAGADHVDSHLEVKTK